jgi:hypothetical protein
MENRTAGFFVTRARHATPRLARHRTHVRSPCDTSAVAGGMLPGRSGRSLGERAANSGVGREPSTPPAREPDSAAADWYRTLHAAAGDGGEGRHCWVRNPLDAPGIWPGLLIEWRQRGGDWQGRVAYTVAGPHGPALVEAWLPAARLEPR